MQRRNVYKITNTTVSEKKISGKKSKSKSKQKLKSKHEKSKRKID